MAEVDNPKYTFLKGLQTRVQEIQSQMNKKLDKPNTNMASGKVWTSKTATAWKGDLSERTTAYNTAMNSLGEQVSAELERTPKKCSQAEADSFNATVNNYNRSGRY